MELLGRDPWNFWCGRGNVLVARNLRIRAAGTLPLPGECGLDWVQACVEDRFLQFELFAEIVENVGTPDLARFALQ